MIPHTLYRKIVELVPILCVDVILSHKGRYILIKRVNEPLKGLWWIPGGRALKGERTMNTAERKVWEETGLKAKNLKIVGIYEDSYPKSAFGIPTSSVSVVYEAEVDDFNPVLDKTSSDIKPSNMLPRRF